MIGTNRVLFKVTLDFGRDTFCGAGVDTTGLCGTMFLLRVF